MKFITIRLLLWALFVSISGVSLGASVGLLIREGNWVGWLGLILFIVGLPLWTVFVFIKYLRDIVPKELDKLMVKK